MMMSEDVMREACIQAMEAQKSTEKQHYIKKNSRSSEVVVFAFGGSWDANAWFDQQSSNSFGETQINNDLFPSLRSIGNNEPATVNQSFLHRFLQLLNESSFKSKVEKHVGEKKQIVFTGHSSGGPVAIFATLWFLEKYTRQQENLITPRCVTFGSPLVGNRILSHALRRQKWADYFTHFVMEYDIVPRIMLAPLSSIQAQLPQILKYFDQKVHSRTGDQQRLKITKLFDKKHRSGTSNYQAPDEALAFFKNVMWNVSAVASHVACDLMENTNSLMDSFSNFIKISPYRPFGTYIFCTGIENQERDRPVVVDNPDAVLQLLLYFSQLSSEEQQAADIAVRSLEDCLGYEAELDKFKMQNLIYLKDLKLSSNGTVSDAVGTMNKALYGLSQRARLCLAAAEEAENRKKKNEKEINSNIKKKEPFLSKVMGYKTKCAEGNMGYYDAFKLQDTEKDFEANVSRLQLANIWDEIIEMLRRYDLPDEFESREEWVKLGTKFRRLVEPLDIANYYRHSKGEDTGSYLGPKGRPKRYKYMQRWYEHANRLPFEELSDSNFWAMVEDLKNKDFEQVKETAVDLEKKLVKWFDHEKVVEKDVFLDESSLSKWWKAHPQTHRSQSVLNIYINN